jgi:hypothetical protein
MASTQNFVNLVSIFSNFAVLGTEFCSGYRDDDGEWNHGFYCPQSESQDAVLCCGTPTYKYCCTGAGPFAASAENSSDFGSSTSSNDFDESGIVDFGPFLIE